MRKRVRACYDKAIKNQKIPSLKLLNYRDSVDRYNYKLAFETLRNLGYEIEESRHLAGKYNGSAMDRIKRIFPDDQ